MFNQNSNLMKKLLIILLILMVVLPSIILISRRFSEYWLETGTGLPADLCEDENDIVDLLDLKEFVDKWLYYCPYNWPLK